MYTFTIGDGSLVSPRLTASISVDSTVIVSVMNGAPSRMDSIRVFYDDSLVMLTASLTNDVQSSQERDHNREMGWQLVAHGTR